MKKLYPVPLMFSMYKMFDVTESTRAIFNRRFANIKQKFFTLREMDLK